MSFHPVAWRKEEEREVPWLVEVLPFPPLTVGRRFWYGADIGCCFWVIITDAVMKGAL